APRGVPRPAAPVRRRILGGGSAPRTGRAGSPTAGGLPLLLGPPLWAVRVHGVETRGESMAHYKYLIVGGGMAAAAAVEGMRAVDAQGTIGLIGAEPDPPYKRPHLTKQLWKGKPLERIWRGTEDKGVELRLGRR